MKIFLKALGLVLLDLIMYAVSVAAIIFVIWLIAVFPILILILVAIFALAIAVIIKMEKIK